MNALAGMQKVEAVGSTHSVGRNDVSYKLKAYFFIWLGSQCSRLSC